ncbi:MAG: hypothetical protein V3T86_18155 [Planctomycetota bacterium]
MRNRLLCIWLGVALWGAACSHDNPAFPILLDPTPFEAQTEGRIETDAFRDTVDTGSATQFEWTASGAVGFGWTLQTPDGSTAALDNPFAAQPMFVPDVDGRYLVSADITFSDGSSASETRRITAGTSISAAACTPCHVARANDVANSGHANCERCHGPGSEHNSDPRNIANSLRAGVCQGCHPGSATQWRNSPHSAEPFSFVLAREDCQRCHTGRGFIRETRGQAFEADPPGAVGATCGACHEPHSNRNEPRLRIFGNVQLTSRGEFNFGRAAACGTCHQSTVADPLAHTATSHRFTFAVHANMIATRGAVEYGMSFSSSFHATTVMRLRSFTGDPNDSDTPDSCVICHMAPSGASTRPDEMGEHALVLRINAEELAIGNCDRCHAGLSTFDRNIGKDYDGDGVARGVQTEVRSLIEILFQALRAADVNNALDRPGGANTEVDIDPDLSLTTPELRQAVWNYNFNVNDGSAGIHNTKYAVQLLQRTYSQITGREFANDFPLADIE